MDALEKKSAAFAILFSTRALLLLASNKGKKEKNLLHNNGRMPLVCERILSKQNTLHQNVFQKRVCVCASAVLFAQRLSGKEI
jgi:hypothetical protein